MPKGDIARFYDKEQRSLFRNFWERNLFKKRLSLVDAYKEYSHLIGSIHDYIMFIRSSKVSLRFEVEADLDMFVPQSFLEKSLTGEAGGYFIDYVDKMMSGQNPVINFKIGDYQPLSFFYRKKDLEKFFSLRRKIEIINSTDICTYIKPLSENYSHYKVWVPEIDDYKNGHFNSVEKGYLLKYLVDFFHANKGEVINLNTAMSEVTQNNPDVAFPELERKTISEIFEKTELSRYFSQKVGKLTFVHPSHFKQKSAK